MNSLSSNTKLHIGQLVSTHNVLGEWMRIRRENKRTLAIPQQNDTHLGILEVCSMNQGNPRQSWKALEQRLEAPRLSVTHPAHDQMLHRLVV
jgi:hypothetical protein